MNGTVGLKQFRQDDRVTSVVFDRAQKLALLIDPQLLVVDDCRSYLRDQGLKLQAVLDSTQLAGPGSAAARVCEENRCELIRPSVAPQVPIELGALRFKLLPAPSKTASGAVALVGEGLLFTGFTSWAEIVNQATFASLPGEEILLGSFDERGVNFSTLAHERARATKGDGSGVASISVEKYAHKIEASTTQSFVDVREPEEYEAGHFPGVRNIPLSELPLHLGELARSEKIYFSCLSGRRSLQAAKTLVYLGFPEVINVSGGYQAWVQAGLKVEKKA